MTNQSDEIKVPGFMREKRSNVNNQTQTEEVKVPKKNRKKLKKTVNCMNCVFMS